MPVVEAVEKGTVAQREDSPLTHTCAEHPFIGDPPCTDACVALCGARDGSPEEVTDDPGPDACVVCETMFAQRYGS